ncbi:MAG: hypothetical protein L0Z50_07385 [Verrucomicrobiales bacterium]|nr:hypothetical protein [Verrucomicrobiales bacterium]
MVDAFAGLQHSTAGSQRDPRAEIATPGDVVTFADDPASGSGAALLSGDSVTY